MSDNFELCGLTIDISRFCDESRHYVSIHDGKAKNTLDAWLSGEPINKSENRAAMHMALRANQDSKIPALFTKPVFDQKKRIKNFIQSCDATNIVHIGIGGSDFGPRLVVDALKNSYPSIRDIRFLSSITPEAIINTMKDLDISKTVFVIASKSFTSDETMFIYNVLRDDYNVPSGRFIAATAAIEVATKAGIDSDSIFETFDWVGGRYSLWSSIGLSIALVYGWDVFEELLNGARLVDDDLINKKSNSIIWKLARLLQAERLLNNRNGLAILPYHSALIHLPTYLQQLIMESNGKPCDQVSAPIVFGNTGTEFQHSFGQFLQQGPDVTTSLFITVQNNVPEPWQKSAQKRLHANASAQAETLWSGQDSDHQEKKIAGGRPSLSICLPNLKAVHLGSLLALFEHITVCDGFMMDINPFDQWGVEAGKKMARSMLDAQ